MGKQKAANEDAGTFLAVCFRNRIWNPRARARSS